MKKLLLLLLLVPNLVMAETTSVWGDDGSLTIIQSENKDVIKKSLNCSAEDYKYAKGDYDPQEAYDFGVKIQSLVKGKNLEGIFNLVDESGESGSVPRKSLALKYSFDEIFDADWVNSVISSIPQCGPLGWRGFMLGSGSIWYNPPKDKSEGVIFGFNGVKELEIFEDEAGWKNNKKLIHPSCFYRPWASGDNYEEYAERFNIEVKKLRYAPGQFFGSKIKNLEPITASWGDKIPLINSLEKCSPENFKTIKSDKSIRIAIEDEFGSNMYKEYSVLKRFPAEKCSKLAPHIGKLCKQSYLLESGDYIGGSMGVASEVGIYGLFDLPKLGLSIVPLRFFDSTNAALNYLDESSLNDCGIDIGAAGQGGKEYCTGNVEKDDKIRRCFEAKSTKEYKTRSKEFVAMGEYNAVEEVPWNIGVSPGVRDHFAEQCFDEYK